MPKYCSECGKKVCANCEYCPKCKRVTSKPKGFFERILGE